MNNKRTQWRHRALRLTPIGIAIGAILVLRALYVIATGNGGHSQTDDSDLVSPLIILVGSLYIRFALKQKINNGQ